MKKFLLFFYRIYKRAKFNIQWRIDIKEEGWKIKKEDVSISELPKGKKLVLIPHSDDEWIGCSSLLKRDDDVILCNMDMDGNDDESTHRRRFDEMRTVADTYKRKLITSGGDKVIFVKKVLAEEKPEFVMLPFFVDWHEEHIAVMDILEKALSGIEINHKLKIAMYQVSLPILIPHVTHCVKMDKKELTQKWKLFKKYYESQKKIIPIGRYKANERINGAYANSYACEVFSVVDVKKWLEIRDDFNLSAEEKKELQKNLQFVSKMRMLLKKYILIANYRGEQ
ncbi:MAG: hypothetical protein E7441_05845 [Ruminococcaceae bacterium]|nr:hypothetical protein [Oscillospiraceae bacterium]